MYEKFVRGWRGEKKVLSKCRGVATAHWHDGVKDEGGRKKQVWQGMVILPHVRAVLYQLNGVGRHANRKM